MAETSQIMDTPEIEGSDAGLGLNAAIKGEVGNFVISVSSFETQDCFESRCYEDEKNSNNGETSKTAKIIRVEQRVPYAGFELLSTWLQIDSVITVLDGITCQKNPDLPRLPEEVSDQRTVNDTVNDPLENDGACNTLQLDRVMFLDIETTGLDDASVVVLGLASITNGEIVVNQLILPSIGNELQLILHGLEYLSFKNATTVITFYGTKFDIPFLQKRLKHFSSNMGDDDVTQRQIEGISKMFDIPSSINHLDLHDLFKALYPGLNRYNFKALEREILGLGERQDDIKGSLIGQQYALFQDAPQTIAKARAISSIIKHNFTDIIHSTFAFHAMIGKIAGAKASKILHKKQQIEAETTKPELDDNAIRCPSQVSRAYPVIVTKADDWGSENDLLRDIISNDDFLACFNTRVDIQEAKKAFALRNSELYAKIEQRGWFFTVEQLCSMNVLERDLGDDIITYRRTNGDLMLTPSPQVIPVTILPLGNIKQAINPDPSIFLDTTSDISLQEDNNNPNAKFPVPHYMTNQSENNDLNAESNSVEDIQAPINFPSKVLKDTTFQDVVKGWLVSCGSINVNDAAKALGVQPMDIKVYLFEQVGKGCFHLKFKDDIFWIPEEDTKKNTHHYRESI